MLCVTMGGGLQRYEPVDHKVFFGDASSCEMFKRRGWLDYYLNLKGFDEVVDLQFLSTLKDGFAMVKGIKIEFIEDVVAKFIGLP